VPWHNPCYNVRVSNPGFVIGDLVFDEMVGLVSTLAPVYALYASHTDKASLPERKDWLRFPLHPRAGPRAVNGELRTWRGIAH